MNRHFEAMSGLTAGQSEALYREAMAGESRCNCDQAIKATARAELALCALQGIKSVISQPILDPYKACEQIATLLGLAEAGLERLNRP